MASHSSVAGGGGGGSSSGSSSGGSGPSTRSGLESAASETARNFILGLPRNGPAPGSADAASLQAAEAFLGEIQQEIMAYDMANARAMEAYARGWWAKVPYFGKRWGSSGVGAARCGSDGELPGIPGVKSGDADPVAAPVVGSVRDPSFSSPCCNNNSNNNTNNNNARDHLRVERTAAKASLPDGGMRHIQKPQPQQQGNSWLFKRRHPGWVPLIQRWWVPSVCIVGIVAIWTPDVWKLRTLYWCDYQYSQLRRVIHKAYWYATMSADEYAALMRDLELNRPPSVKATDCPL